MSSPRLISDVPAPAKLNLFLHVVGRRDDGYHLLQSLFALVDWQDTLHFERRADGRLQRHDLGAPLPDDDLCLRAARALQQASGTAWGADISIDKQLPSGAGMGGGSSDAASTLIALNRLWELHWTREQLARLALPLGADVPFFIGGRSAFVEGIGELLTPVRLPERWLAVVKPSGSIDTRRIFTHPDLVRDTQAAILAGFLADPERLDAWIATQARNDLQRVAETICPEVSQALAWLEQRFGTARMTGSGSAVFAEAGRAEQPSATLLADVPAAWVGRICRSLETHPLHGWVEG